MMKFDETQQKVIDFQGGRALVLAAPGCGKTEILSQRVLRAHQDYGVDYSDMLCVTFTNRAARSMKDRVRAVVGDKALADLFVGNLHKFCISFLMDNDALPADVTLFDEEEQYKAICEFVGRPDVQSADLKGVLDYTSHIFEAENDFPQGLHLHRHALPQYEAAARWYINYKREHSAVDFDDLLLLAYRLLLTTPRESLKRGSFRWIQVDEVQDLNPLQLAILDALAAPDLHSMVYLGDERQSIYSFLGSNSRSVAQIAVLCQGNVFSLSNNYRSPIYLLDMLNDFAHFQLGQDRSRLPTSTNNVHLDDALLTLRCDSMAAQYDAVARLVLRMRKSAPDETVGILLRSNNSVESVSRKLSDAVIPHFRTTNRDMFKTSDYKALVAHFAVVASDVAISQWVRILAHTRALADSNLAFRCVSKMRSLGISPSDLLDYDGKTYVTEFSRAFAEREVVIFDTETTGTEVYSDDIIQIAAIKMRGGKIVPGSEFDVIIETDKEIPAMLGDIPNPMVEEYARRPRLSAQEALQKFVDYVGDCEMLGHNVMFDARILMSNIRRRTIGISFSLPTLWDSLRLARLLHPELRVFKLVELLKVFNLEGENSHNAFDDIRATFSLVVHCHEVAATRCEQHIAFVNHPSLRAVRSTLQEVYLPIYSRTRALLSAPEADDEHSFAFEFQRVYSDFLKAKIVSPIQNFSYIVALFRKSVFAHEGGQPFLSQLYAHLGDLRTFNETDLYENGVISEPVHVMTIHKSKGLEFDNVVVVNVTEGYLPSARISTKEDLDESARMLYVAISRARKRVVLTYFNTLSRFISGPVREHFDDLEL